MGQRRGVAIAILTMLASVLALPARSQTLAEYFKGKSIEFYVPAGPGGGFDAYARAMAPYLRKHFPGQPNINIVNMPGAGGIAMTRKMYESSPKDGTVLALLNRVALGLSKMEPSKVGLDLGRLAYIGSMSSEIGACYAWAPTGIASLEDFSKRKVVFADTSIGGIGYVYSSIMGALFNGNAGHVLGYLNSADAWLAVEKGEAEANCNGWYSVVVQKPDWIAQKKINVLLQFGEKPLPGLESVPLIYSLPMTEDQRRAIAFLIRSDEISRTVIAPPDTLPDRVAAWRDAMAATAHDPDFIAFAAKSQIELDFVDGPHVKSVVDEILGTPPSALTLAAKIMQ